MVDIVFGDYSKKILRMGAFLVRKKLHTDIKTISEDMSHCGNPAIAAINKILVAGADNIEPGFQRRTAKDFGQLGLWILYKDTAYRDVFFWMLYQILSRADTLLPLVEPFVKPVNEWYPNDWVHQQQESQRLKQEHKIPDNGKCLGESIYTPSIQNKRHKKILEGKNA